MTFCRSILSTRLLATWCVCVLLQADAHAETPALSRTKYTNGAAVRRAFSDVVTAANEWTVRIKGGDAMVAYGTIVRANGYIVTKASQLHGDLVVRLPDGRELPARHIGYNSDHDVALIKVDANDLQPVVWEDHDDPDIGGWVVTPDQQGAPSSVGVVSVSRRSIPRLHEPALLGIGMETSLDRVVVNVVYEGSAAEKAGLLVDDVILKVDGVAVATPDGMKYEITRRSPGDTIDLHLERAGKSIMLRATLTHPFGEFQSRIAMQNHMGGELSERRSGFPVVLQHDSVINPDECGGPLVNLSGQAIGINIARAGRTESYAIPDDVLRPLIQELMKGDHPTPGEHQPTIAADVNEQVTTPVDESDTAGQ